MMLKKDYEEMTEALVRYLKGFEGSSTGYVPTQRAKEAVINRVREIMEAYGVEVTA